MEHRIWDRVNTRLLAWASVVVLIGIPLGIPLFQLCEAVLGASDGELVVMSSGVWRRVLFTVWESGLTVVCSVIVGGGLALWEHRVGRSSQWFLRVALLPTFLPSVVVAFGAIAVFGYGGAVNAVLGVLGVAPVRWLYNPAAIIVAHTYYNAPLMYVALRSRLQQHDRHHEEAAQLLGASGWRVFWDITWPRVRRTVISVGFVVAGFAALSFALPLLLGGIQQQTVEVAIYQRLVQHIDVVGASALSLMQFGALVGLGLAMMMSGRADAVAEERVRLETRDGGTGMRSAWWLRVVQGVTGALLLVPPIAVVLRAVTQEGVGANIATLWERGFFGHLWFTIALGVLVSALTVLAAVTLVGTWPSHASRWVLILFTLSPVMLGVAWQFTFGRSVLSLGMAYLTLGLPLTTYLVANAWSARPPQFAETLTLLGANRWQRIVAMVQFLRPTLFRATALALVLILGDIAIGGTLSPPGSPTAMAAAYQFYGAYRSTLAMTGIAVILLTIAALLFLLTRIQHFYDPRRS